MTPRLRRAVVTGVRGFLGRHLVRELERQGTVVTGLARRAAPGERWRAVGSAPWAPRRLAAIIEEAAPDAVFHLAGATDGPPARLDAVNHGLAETLMAALDLARARPVLVCCGSAAEYGRGVVDGVATAEGAACLPTTPYGDSKLAQTRSVLAFGGASGTRVVVARIFNLVGPGMPSHLALAEFARQIAGMPPQGGVLRTGDLDVGRDFIDVAVAARALRLLAEQPAACGVVNVCGGHATPLRRLTELLIAASGRPVRLERDAARLRPGELREVFGDPASLRHLVGRLEDTDHPAVVAQIWREAARAVGEGARCPV